LGNLGDPQTQSAKTKRPLLRGDGGNEGWELVAITMNAVAYLKRQINNPGDAPGVSAALRRSMLSVSRGRSFRLITRYSHRDMGRGAEPAAVMPMRNAAYLPHHICHLGAGSRLTGGYLPRRLGR
jgi:hypothetical protein